MGKKKSKNTRTVHLIAWAETHFKISCHSMFPKNSDNQRLPGAKTNFIKRKTEPQGHEVPKGIGS